MESSAKSGMWGRVTKRWGVSAEIMGVSDEDGVAGEDGMGGFIARLNRLRVNRLCGELPVLLRPG